MPLSKDKLDVIGECLRASAYGPFFPEGEFGTIFGLTRDQVASVADEWPVVVRNAEIADVAVNSSLNNLTGYPIKLDKMLAWDDFISIERKELITLFRKWRAGK